MKAYDVTITHQTSSGPTRDNVTVDMKSAELYLIELSTMLYELGTG